MPKPTPLANIAQLKVTYAPSAIGGFALLWAALGALAYRAFGLPPATALTLGFIGSLLHYASELWHQLGHARAARQTGHPMTGIRYWAIFATSIYPPDEGELPGAVHVRRALGGPAASSLLTLLAGLLALAAGLPGQPANPLGRTVWMLIAFLFLDNLLFFALGALLPLGFTDGSTLLKWWGKR